MSFWANALKVSSRFADGTNLKIFYDFSNVLLKFGRGLKAVAANTQASSIIILRILSSNPARLGYFLDFPVLNTKMVDWQR